MRYTFEVPRSPRLAGQPSVADNITDLDEVIEKPSTEDLRASLSEVDGGCGRPISVHSEIDPWTIRLDRHPSPPCPTQHGIPCK